MLSSPNPLPIQSCPFSPLVGNDGPNAAGLARKAVVLSCVRVMIAFGGKRENGALKEKNAWMPLFCGFVEAAVIVCGGWEDLRDRYVKKTVVTKNTPAMMTLGGRMMLIEPFELSKNRISSAAARHKKGSHPRS
jgi:hypothetical protein